MNETTTKIYERVCWDFINQTMPTVLPGVYVRITAVGLMSQTVVLISDRRIRRYLRGKNGMCINLQLPCSRKTFIKRSLSGSENRVNDLIIEVNVLGEVTFEESGQVSNFSFYDHIMYGFLNQFSYFERLLMNASNYFSPLNTFDGNNTTQYVPPPEIQVENITSPSVMNDNNSPYQTDVSKKSVFKNFVPTIVITTAALLICFLAALILRQKTVSQINEGVFAEGENSIMTAELMDPFPRVMSPIDEWSEWSETSDIPETKTSAIDINGVTRQDFLDTTSTQAPNSKAATTTKNPLLLSTFDDLIDNLEDSCESESDDYDPCVLYQDDYLSTIKEERTDASEITSISTTGSFLKKESCDKNEQKAKKHIESCNEFYNFYFPAEANLEDTVDNDGLMLMSPKEVKKQTSWLSIMFPFSSK